MTQEPPELLRAAAHADLPRLEQLVQGGADVDQRVDLIGRTVLHVLLDERWVPAAAAWLCAHGASTELRSGPRQETALHIAARRRRLDAIDLLLDHGAAIDARTKGGKTAHAHAARRGFDEIAARLRERGADATLAPADELAFDLVHGRLDAARARIASHPGLVPAMGPEEMRIVADLAGRFELEPTRILLDAGVEVDARGLDGGTALQQAGWFGQPAQAELLLAHGADVNATGDDHCSTPLGWVAHGSRFSGGAAERGAEYVRLAELLLAAGASLVHPDAPAGEPPGRWLLFDASHAVAAVLRRHGAKDA
jgi:ankyrin repeat protein